MAIRQVLSKFLLLLNQTLVIADWWPNKSAFLLFRATMLFARINLQTFVLENLSFKSDNAILHNGKVTKINFSDDRAFVWNRRVYELIFLDTCASFSHVFRVMFCELCSIRQHVVTHVQKRYIFTWWCKF